MRELAPRTPAWHCPAASVTQTEPVFRFQRDALHQQRLRVLDNIRRAIVFRNQPVEIF